MEDNPAARRGIVWIELEGNGGLRNKSDIFLAKVWVFFFYWGMDKVI